MNILKVWDGEYPWDVRTEKICRSLTEAGHSVQMVARNRDRRPLVEELEECTVHRMPPFRILGSAIDAASQFPAFFNPRWVRLMHRVGKSTKADRILVRDLPLAPTAIHVGRRLGVPVVLDMAENYPAMIRDLWTTDSTKFGDRLVRNPKAVEAVERWTLQRIDHTLVVVEESRDRLVSELGVDPSTITVVGNTPSLSRIVRGESPTVAAGEPPSETTPPLRLIYLGLLEHARGLGAIIEAVAICHDRGVPVELTVIGDGRASEDFRRQADSLRLTETQVRFHGYVPYEDALLLLEESEVGVIPHLANESWNTTIPNKLFDYMAAGLAILTSEARPTRRVVESAGAGVSFEGGSASSAAGAIEQLQRRDSLIEMGRRGRRAVLEEFNWERDQERLLQAIEGCVAGA
jgi:glycosyltransferase involved in cell wall biosynthesis